MGCQRGTLCPGVKDLAVYWDPGLAVGVPYARVAVGAVHSTPNAPRLSWMCRAPVSTVLSSIFRSPRRLQTLAWVHRAP